MRFPKPNRHAERAALSRYWTALVGGAPADELARLAESLDPTTLATIDRVRALRRQRHAPDSAFVARLERDLMNAFVSTPALGVPFRPDAPPATNGRIAPAPRPDRAPAPPRSPLLTGWAVASLAIAILLLLVGGSLVGYRAGWLGGSNDGFAGIPAPDATPATPRVAPVWETRGGPDLPLAHPTILALDPAGNLWVTDGGNSRFQIFAPDGTFLETWGTPGSGDGQLNLAPGGEGFGSIVFAPDGSFYVVDTGNRRVQRFSSDRTFVTSWGGEGRGDGQFLRPWDVAVDSQGRVYVVDDQRSDVQVFDAEGRFLFKFGEYGRQDGQLLDTGGIAVAPDGSIWVADWGNSRLQRFAADGTFLEARGRRPFGTEPGAFFNPADLAFDAAGRLYVTEHGNRRVQVFAPDGTVLATWGGSDAGETQVGDALGIAVDGAGHVYVGDWAGGVVRTFRLLLPPAS